MTFSNKVLLIKTKQGRIFGHHRKRGDYEACDPAQVAQDTIDEHFADSGDSFSACCVVDDVSKIQVPIEELSIKAQGTESPSDEVLCTSECGGYVVVRLPTARDQRTDNQKRRQAAKEQKTE